VELISSAERNKLFDRFEREAFHLELRDDYSLPDEDGPFQHWLAGHPTDTSFLTPWLHLVQRATARGMAIRRVRIVTEPVSAYIRWEHEITPLNEQAGETIRWLPRHLLPDHAVFPFDQADWWLFDDRLVAVGHFDPDGRVLGSELVEKADAVRACARLRDELWARAIPHSDYQAPNCP
jgi:hypothetical protein